MKTLLRTATLVAGVLALGVGCGRATSTLPTQQGQAAAPPAAAAPEAAQRHVQTTVADVTDLRATIPREISAADASKMLVSLKDITLDTTPARYGVLAFGDVTRSDLQDKYARDHAYKSGGAGPQDGVTKNDTSRAQDNSRSGHDTIHDSGFGGLYGRTGYFPGLYTTGYYGGLGLYGGLGSILSGYIPGTAYNYSNYMYYRSGNTYFPYTSYAGNYYPYEYTPSYLDTYASSYDPFLIRRGSVYSPYYYSNVTANQAPVANANVNIQRFTFLPATIVVAVGGSVRWTNMDTVAHSATPNFLDANGNVMWTGDLAPGATSQPMVFSARGDFPYHCRFHPTMTGVVSVR